MEINQLRTTPYKPSTNGTVERFHRTLNSMLGPLQTDENTYVKVPVDADPTENAVDNMPLEEATHQLDPTANVDARETVDDCSGDEHGVQSDDRDQCDLTDVVDDTHSATEPSGGANRESSINVSGRESTAAELVDSGVRTNSGKPMSNCGRSDNAVVRGDGGGSAGLAAAHGIQKQDNNNSNNTLNHDTNDSLNNTFRRAKRDRRIPARFADFVM